MNLLEQIQTLYDNKLLTNISALVSSYGVKKYKLVNQSLLFTLPGPDGFICSRTQPRTSD